MPTGRHHSHTCRTSAAEKPTQPDKAIIAFWLGVLLFALYLLTFSGKLHVMDELAVFSAGNNLAQRARADINNLVWTNHWTPNPPGMWGRDDNLYTKKAPGVSVLAAPLIWLGHILPGLNAVHLGLLLSPVITAATAAFIFLWLLDLDFSRFTALFTALLYGLGAMPWVYARMFWGLSVAGLLFLLAIWAARRITSYLEPEQRALWVLLAGAAMALSITMRFEALVAAALLGLYLLLAQSPDFRPKTLARTLRAKWLMLSVYFFPSVLIVSGLLAFNFIRFGSFSETGYTQELSFSAPWTGALGMLFSPGKGLFIYSPVLILLFFGLRPAWRRLPRIYFWLIALISLFYVFFYGAWFSWGGAWGWGPRFLLPIIPLLMLFVAEVVELGSKWAGGLAIRGAGDPGKGDRQYAGRSSLKASLIWAGIGTLIALGLLVNALGMAIDFNDYYKQLEGNDDFIFNWAKFPPLAHWRILREGGDIDLICLDRGKEGTQLYLHLLLPPFIILLMALLNLRAVFAVKGGRQSATSPPMAIGLTLFLSALMLWGAAHLDLKGEQSQADLPLLDLLKAEARRNDVLLAAMPPFGDAQEFSTWLMAYQDRRLPTYAWIEHGPRAIKADERERVWRAASSDTQRVWLFERWLSRADPTGETAKHLNQIAFPVREAWFDGSGKLTLYALAQINAPTAALNVPFEGGLTLLDFAILNERIAPGDILKLRLTWQAEAAGADAALPPGATVAFVQLLAEEKGQAAVQQDRLLIDLRAVEQSPLLPGQSVRQGYGLSLPEDLSPGPYSLIVGLYEAATTQRLFRADDSPDDFLYLTTIQVGR